MKETTSFSQGKMLLIFDKIPFFREFSVHERERILRHAHFFVAQEAEYIIQQNDTQDTSFYILMSGLAAVTVGEDEFSVAVIKPGDFFGEISFVLGVPRSSNVVAQSVCILLQVDRRLLGELSAEIREKVKDKVIEKLALLLQKQNGKIDLD